MMVKSADKYKSRDGGNSFADALMRYPAIVLLLLVVAVYARTTTFDLSYCDDVDIIITNYERIDDFDRLDDELMRGYIGTDYYRPVINFSFWFDSQIGGQNPTAYHATNVIIHFLASMALFWLFRAMKFYGYKPLIAAAVFAVHPLFVNAVAWIVGRNDMIYTLFGLLSFIGLLRHIRSGQNGWLGLHFAALLLAFLTKETAFALPLVFAGYLIMIKKGKLFSTDNIIYGGLWIIAAVVWYALRSAADIGESVNRMGWDIFVMNLPVVAEFFGKFFLPAEQSVLPTYSLFPTLAGLAFIALLITGAIINKRRRWNYFAFGALWYLAPILPAMLVTVANSNDWNEYLECRAYFPAIGIFIMLFELLPQKWLDLARKTPRIIFAIIIIILALLAYFESSNYRGPQQFYESAIEDDPSRALFHEILGNIYKEQEDLRRAEKEYLRMIEANPTYGKYYHKLGVFYMRNGRYEDAEKYLSKSIAMIDSGRSSYNALAMVYFQMRKYPRVDSVLRIALGIWPKDSELLYGMVYAHLSMGNPDSAFAYAEKIIAAGHDKSGVVELFSGWADKYIDKEEYDKAAVYARKAIELDSARIEPYRFMYYYSYAIKKDYDKAAQYAKRIIDLGGEIDPAQLEFLRQYGYQGN
jgi:tetratricopeptide (TPR) repeat protein